jgi:hypothetical protein
MKQLTIGSTVLGGAAVEADQPDQGSAPSRPDQAYLALP